MEPEDEDLLREFFRLFDPDPEAEPADGEEVAEIMDDMAAALARPAGGEIAEELAGMASALSAEDAPTTAAALTALDTLARRSTGLPHDILAAGTQLTRAGEALAEERWAAARRLATRARALLGPRVLPVGIGHCEQLLGEAAMQLDDVDAARRHWTASRAAHLAAGHTEDAAIVTGGLAEIADREGNVDGAAERLWGETADLLAAAGDPGQARGYAERSCARVMAFLMALPDHGDTARPFARARYAHQLAGRHGLPVQAAQFGVHTAIMGADQGLPWAEISDMFARARTAFRSLPSGTGTPAQLELALAKTDFAEGSAAVNRALPVVAEPALRAALPVLERLGSPLEVMATRQMLAGLREVVDPVLARSDDLLERVVEGGIGDSPVIAELRELGLEARTATAALERGDLGPAQACVARIERFLADGSPVYRGASHGLEVMLGMLRVGLDLRGGSPGSAASRASTAQRDLADLESRMLERESGFLAAQIAVGRGMLLLDAGDATGAVQVLVPAVLALDAVRFSLDGADRRRRWAAVVAAGFAAAYRAAHAAGDIRLLAELIEVARANAVPAPMAAGAGPALDTVLDGAPAPVEPAGPAPVAALAGSAMLGNGEESRTLLGRPAHLRTPWGTVALAGPLDAARAYTDPLRAGVVVDWLIPSQVITALPAARPPGGSAPRGPG